MKAPRNMAASVRQRLANRARERGETFDIVLTRYALERLLYRLGQSEHRDCFILKGAMLFSLWTDTPYRETRDLDLLGFGSNDVHHLEETFRSLCMLSVTDDGVTFDPDSVQTEPMREEENYAGGRVRLVATIAGVRLSLQIDIGFGDAVTPAPEEISYPALLPFPAPRIRAYPKETVVAEKYEALISLGMTNSRMKDFYDLWVMSSTFAFEGEVLAGGHRRHVFTAANRVARRSPSGHDRSVCARPAERGAVVELRAAGQTVRAPASTSCGDGDVKSVLASSFRGAETRTAFRQPVGGE